LLEAQWQTSLTPEFRRISDRNLDKTQITLVTGPGTAPIDRPIADAWPAVLNAPDRHPASTTSVALVDAAISRFLAMNLLRTKSAMSWDSRELSFPSLMWSKGGQSAGLVRARGPERPRIAK
jgi:hypothetical protein